MASEKEDRMTELAAENKRLRAELWTAVDRERKAEREVERLRHELLLARAIIEAEPGRRELLRRALDDIVQTFARDPNLKEAE
jgi:hypothetical protein